MIRGELPAAHHYVIATHTREELWSVCRKRLITLENLQVRRASTWKRQPISIYKVLCKGVQGIPDLLVRIRSLACGKHAIKS